MKRTIYKTTPRQLNKVIWIRDESVCGNWAFDYINATICCMDAPECIPAGSTKWSLSYVDENIEYGEPTEKLIHREGWF